jgi:Spy/CpxP family protein refolding chaperone
MNALQTKMTRMALLAVCSAALTAPIAVLAQDTPPPPPPAQDGGGPGGPGGGHHGDRMEQMKDREAHQLEALTKHLNLTADQQTQVKQVFADSDAKLAAVMTDGSPREQKRPKMMQLMQDRQAAVRAVLTPDQQPKYDEMLAKEKERMQEHKHGGPGGAGAPPSGDSAPPPPTQQ